jgi:hypothetical protein
MIPLPPSRSGVIASRAVVAALLLIHALLLAWIAFRNSPTIDEVGHLPAGICIDRFGRFDIYRVNPPLVKAVAALPVVLWGPTTNWKSFYMEERSEWNLGTDFIVANGERAFWYFTLARWACIPLSLLGGLICYRWASDLYGRPAGLLALSFWCFSPNVLANASMITPDAGATAVGVAACYAFWRWLGAPGWARAAVAGVALGLAELTKLTWLVLYLVWPTVWLVRFLSTARERGEGRRQAGQFALVMVLSLYVINAAYGFEGTFRRLGSYRFVSRALAGPREGWKDRRSGGNRFAGTRLGEVPVPLPCHLLGGLDLQRRDFEIGMPSYLRGELRHGGWWYFYLYALAVKEPLGTWCLAGLAAALSLSRRYRAGWREELALLAPAAAVLVLVSSQTGFSRYLRYVLPIFPFAYIGISKVALSLRWRDRAAAGLMAAALAWSILSSLAIYPLSLSYFNELAGGPAGGHYHLIDASIDWGQDLFRLKEWIDAHPGARPLYVDFFGAIGLEHFGIKPEPYPEPLKPGWYAVSVHRLHESEGNKPFLSLEPVDRIGYSMNIYHLSKEQARRAADATEAPRVGEPQGPSPDRR